MIVLDEFFFLNFSFCISNKGYKICSSFFNSFLSEKTNFPKTFLLISPSIFNKPLTFSENEFTIWALTFFFLKSLFISLSDSKT